MALRTLREPTEHSKAQPKAVRQRAPVYLKASPENLLPETRRVSGGVPENPVSRAMRWLAEADAQIARQKAFAARISNQDKFVALQARMALSQTLCCITREILRESRDRMARILRESVDGPTPMEE